MEETLSQELDNARRVMGEAGDRQDQVLRRYQDDLERESSVRIEARMRKSLKLKSEEAERRDAYWNIMEQEGRRQEREGAHEVEMGEGAIRQQHEAVVESMKVADEMALTEAEKTWELAESHVEKLGEDLLVTLEAHLSKCKQAKQVGQRRLEDAKRGREAWLRKRYDERLYRLKESQSLSMDALKQGEDSRHSDQIREGREKLESEDERQKMHAAWVESKAEDAMDREARQHSTSMMELSIRQGQAKRVHDARIEALKEKNNDLEDGLSELISESRALDLDFSAQEEDLKASYETQFAKALSISEESARNWENQRVKVREERDKSQAEELRRLQDEADQSVAQLSKSLQEEQGKRKAMFSDRRKAVQATFKQALATKEVEKEMIEECSLETETVVESIRNRGDGLSEAQSKKEEALMLRLEKQLARYVLMNDTILEEFTTLEQNKAVERLDGFEELEAKQKSREEALLKKLDGAYEEFISQNKKQMEQSRRDQETRNTREIERISNDSKIEIMEIASGHEHYEEACRQRYSLELSKQQTKADEDRREALSESTEELERESNRQYDRASMFESVKSEANKLVHGKYDRILTELGEAWSKESDERDSQFVAKARSYWENHSEAVSRQLDVTQKSLSVMEHSDLIDWHHEIELVEAAHSSRESLVEITEVSLYEDQFCVTQEQLACRKENALEELKKLDADPDVETEAGLEVTFAQALESEKHKYEDRWEDAWGPIEKMVDELRVMYAREIGPVDPSKEQEALETLLSVHEAGLNARSPASPHFVMSDNKKELTKMMSSLDKVWEALDVTHEESCHFFDRATERLPQTQSLQKIFETEASKLAERQAIREMLNKREELLDGLVGSDEDLDPSRRHFVEIKTKGEIQGLDETLRRFIPMYEEKHRERFMYQGRAYLEKMDADQRKYL